MSPDLSLMFFLLLENRSANWGSTSEVRDEMSATILTKARSYFSNEPILVCTN